MMGKLVAAESSAADTYEHCWASISHPAVVLLEALMPRRQVLLICVKLGSLHIMVPCTLKRSSAFHFCGINTRGQLPISRHWIDFRMHHNTHEAYMVKSQAYQAHSIYPRSRPVQAQPTSNPLAPHCNQPVISTQHALPAKPRTGTDRQQPDNTPRVISKPQDEHMYSPSIVL